MTKQFNFTQPKIRALPIPPVGRVEYRDSEIPKLACRVTSTGNKTFLVVKWVDGKSQRLTIGNFKDVTVSAARDQARIILADIVKGVDVQANKRQDKAEATTLVQLLDQYLEGRKLKESTAANYRYKLKLGFEDWLNKPVSSISDIDVLKRQKRITNDQGATTANTTNRVLRLTLNYGVATKLIASNPTDILKEARLWHKSKRKERLIPSDKLQSWYEAVEALPNEKAKVYLLTLLYTGCRSGEALSLKWENVDLKAKTITLVDTKNRRVIILPVTTKLVPYLKQLHKSTGTNEWVFPNTDGTGAMVVPNKPITQVINSCGVEFSPHDLRRTYATIAESVNLPLTIIKRLLNHVTTNDVTGGYIHTEQDTLRDASNKVASFIQSKVTQQDNVVQLPVAKRG